MTEGRTTRRLAAILAADVVGYSRLMAADETGTLSALKQHRERLFDPTVAAHNGRIVKLIGDGTLVEFTSVVEALECALSIQTANSGEPAANRPQIVLRIGVNLGDVIIDGDDIYGDGVNVAARLEPLAEPGGVCIASIVNESTAGRVKAAFADGGEVHVKNIDRPLRIWRWHPASEPAAVVPSPAAAAEKTKAARAIPSIAVLPFTNMSGDAEQEYFSDGISEDIITDLSKVGGLVVIARNSSFAYKGKNVDVRTIGRELGVGVVLEGSIRRAGNRVRITAQLIDAANGAHLWAERYDRDLTDIFAVQDEVTGEIVKALSITLTPREQTLLAGGGTGSVEAHDLVLRARELLLRPEKTRQNFERTVQWLQQALTIDPNYAGAYATLAWVHQLDYQNRWSGDSDGALKRSLDYVDKAIALDPNDAFGHYVAAIITTFMRDLDRASSEVDKALALSPNYALAINARGVTNLYKGDAEKGIPDIERAMRLDLTFSQQYLHFLGVAYLLAGRYETAAAHFRERILLVPETDFSRAFLASALGHLGEIEEARRIWQDLKRVNPKYTFEGHMQRLPFRRQADVARIVEGLAKAGLPD
ncbi:MAG TPA: adenylate/guanylate cyclase domain-containing protein [Bauldia sp.]|nr:adenylate/guanylate cyclase domain-containing protein [Bauldia sp.]